MVKGCPNCKRFIDDAQKFCSRKCFNEYHGVSDDTPVGDTLRSIGRLTEIPEEEPTAY